MNKAFDDPALDIFLPDNDTIGLHIECVGNDSFAILSNIYITHIICDWNIVTPGVFCTIIQPRFCLNLIRSFLNLHVNCTLGGSMLEMKFGHNEG